MSDDSDGDVLDPSGPASDSKVAPAAGAAARWRHVGERRRRRSWWRRLRLRLRRVRRQRLDLSALLSLPAVVYEAHAPESETDVAEQHRAEPEEDPAGDAEEEAPRPLE